VAEIEQELTGRAHTTAIAALEVAPFAMLITDTSAQALAVNGKWSELTGLGRGDSLGAGWLSVLEPDSRSRLREDILTVARGGEGTSVDYQIGSGTPLHKRWARWWISRHDLDGASLLAVGVADVDDYYARQANLYHLATHDPLTGLVNRSHFMECIDQALRRSQRQARHVAVVYIDLDGFKRVNDRGGHSLGDRVLYAIAARLRHAVRGADMVARIGGDEFAVLCEGLSASEQADVVARRVASALTESVDLDGDRWSVAASVGAAVDRGGLDSPEDLVDRADRAMYIVKLSRRDPAETDGADVPQESAGPSERRVPPRAGPGTATGADAARTLRPAPPSREPDAGRLGPDEARRALRDLARAASVAAPAIPQADVAPAPPLDPARQRLASDVLNLRESIEAIRGLLDRFLAAEAGVIDIRDEPVRSEQS
jgi:diguanylate cyclase (GGDEF)-like protein/PAS domain S-box-containing protein